MTKIKKQSTGFILLTALFISLCATVGAIGAADYTIPDDISARSYLQASQTAHRACAELYYDGEAACVSGFENPVKNVDTLTATAKIFGIPFKRVEVSVYKDIMLIPGGDAFGVRLHSNGVIIVGMDEYESSDGITNPAKLAGLRIRDVITEIDSKRITKSEQLTEIIEKSGGKKLNITYTRDGKEYKTELTLQKGTDGKYKAGIWVKDSTAGIGTVTYYNTSTGTFGGLGHGVCEAETGQLLPFYSGEAYNAIISGTVKGIPGDPGELRGYFSSAPIGVLTANTEQGVFGKINAGVTDRRPIPVGLKNEVKTGDVTIYCTTDGNSVRSAEAKIVKIVSNDADTKNFIIEITDTRLLAQTGGIVQGLSGSPIIQNGKIIGAVTHVMINDPTRGYGIFIENMLKAEAANG